MRQVTAVRITGYTGFMLIMVYLFWYLRQVDLSLVYYWQQSVPLPFAEYLPTPGGVSGYLGDWFLETLTGPLKGRICVILLVGVVFFSLHLIFRRLKDSPLFYFLLLAALIPFIMIFAHYRLPAGLILSLATGFLLSAVHSLYAPRNHGIGAAYNFLFAVLVYMATGAAGLIILVQAVIIRAIISKNYMALLTAIPVLVVPLVYLPFDGSVTIKQAYLGSFLISKYSELAVTVYFSLFSPLLILLLYKGLDPVLSRSGRKWMFLVYGTGIVVVLATLFFASRAAINEEEREVFRIYQAAFQKDWQEVIRLTSGRPYLNQLVQYEVNKALYHTGRLLDDMFLYPQRYAEKALFLEGNASSRIAIHMISFYYDMGFANEARHWANEAHVGLMRHPVVLKNLAMTYLAMGYDEAARKYLRILSGSGLHRDWAGQVLQMIENGTAGDDPEIRRFAHNNPGTDFFAGTGNPTSKLKAFYLNNPDNQMAFEFLIASYLLQHRLGDVISYLPVFRELGYAKLPQSVEEAILVYVTRSREQSVPMAGYRVSQKAWEEFQDFSRLVASTGDRDEKINKASKYGSTYCFYILFNSPYASK
ncbi:MAG TPA: hypothetical protein ENO20_04060 [Bacteroides sp.]|nr:hypothetical protein [Bacteroides sp.]